MTIVRDVTIGPVRLIQGDMREVLPLLDDRAAVVASDPPYRLTPGGNTSGAMRGCFAPENYDNSGELFPMVEWVDMAPLIYGALRENADAIIMTSDREEATARAAFLAQGFKFHRLLVWDKVTATPNRWFMQNCEFALYLYKGAARTITNPGSKALVRVRQRDVAQHYMAGSSDPATPRPAGHPTEKPVELMMDWVVNTTDPGDLVLDPFAGTGSTLVAAARAGRRAIGVELNPVWFDVACARVREVVETGKTDLFQTAPVSAVQGDLLA